MKYETDWGLPLEEVYTPEDVKHLDHERDINDPGRYPFTRGHFRAGYRSKDPSKRMTVGFGTPGDTNQRLKYLRSKGEKGGISLVEDKGTQMTIDSDHPMATKEAGLVGIPLCHIGDFEELFDGIPLVGQTLTINTTPASAPLKLAMLIVLCEKQGVDPTMVRGTMGAETSFSSVFGQEDPQPFDLSYKLVVDQFEYQTRHKMKLHFNTVSQHARETGANLAYELGIALAMWRDLIDRMLARDLQIDDFAGRVANLCSMGTRFFEEIAKVRALRKLWSKLITERYGAKNPRSCQINLSLHSSGTSLTYQQPLNNITRGTVQAMAAALAGCTAYGLSTLDEPICEPTEFASRIALNTEYIVHYETGAAWVTDPLGGSYYVEYLTKKLEEEAWKIFDQIESMGGLQRAIEIGWWDETVLKQRLAKQRAIENRDRILIGVNELVIPPEEEDPIPLEEVKRDVSDRIVRKLVAWKTSRNMERVEESLRHLYEDAQKGDKFNLMPAVINAVRDNATVGEIWGTIRMAHKLPYDPFGMIESPFQFA